MRRSIWVCKGCGLAMSSLSQPEDRKWNDGHVCHFERRGEGVPVPAKVCPRCKRRRMYEDNSLNSLGEDGVYICPFCREEELLADLYRLRTIKD